VRKRAFRSLWIQRINAGARVEGFTYSQFIHGLDVAGIVIDRKVLSDIAGKTRSRSRPSLTRSAPPWPLKVFFGFVPIAI
jgi:ribosomal protein L20